MTAIAIRTGEDAELEAVLIQRIYEYNADATGYHDAESFSASQRSDSGDIDAGIIGFTWGGCCVVSYLWVSEMSRRHGIGGKLLDAVEPHAQAKRCQIVFLSSHTFQAPAFYTRRGYAAVARIEDYPLGHADILLVKRLPP